MRIAALHLLAYGPFTGRSLIFGFKPGLHVIYGDNEAGKSTTLRALSSVLFGYPHEAIDGYKHDAKDIALGADLVGQDGQKLSFQRRRRGKNALAKTDGTPLAEATLSKMLGGASKEVFEKVFALDHHRLHEHARALLSEGGSLGFTLAAAGSGLAGLKAALDRLKTERAALFLPGGSKPKLNQRIAQLVESRKEARRRSVSPEMYKKRKREIDDIETALTETRANDRALEAELRRFERVGRNLPRRAQHVAVLGRLEALAPVPLLAADATQKRVKAETDRDTAETDLARATAALADLEREKSEITLDQAILDKSAEVEAISKQRAVIENADNSLPRRDAERTQHYETVRNLLARAEINGAPTDLAALLPSLVKRKQVSILATKGRALATREETSNEAASVADEDVRVASERLAATDAPADMTALRGALLTADNLGDIGSDIGTRRRVLVTKAKTTRDGIIGLGLEDGDASSLRKLRVPSDETVARFRQAFASTDADQTAQAMEIARLQEELDGVERQIENLGRGGAVATKEELEARRAARDKVWTVLRGLYIDKDGGLEDQAKALTGDGDLADAFERRKTDADTTADVIIAHTKEAAELSLSLRRKAEIETKMAATRTKGDAVRARLKALEAEWASLWPPEAARIQPPAEMAEWLKRRETLLREDLEQQTESGAIGELEVKQSHAREGLFAALNPLAAVESRATLTALRTQARGLIEAGAIAATKHAKAIDALENAEQRKRQADAARARIATQTAEWATAWKSALRDARMKETLSIDAAVTILDVMTELDTLKPQIDELTHRIQTMLDEKADFEAAVAALGPLVAGCDGVAATEISRQLDGRLKTAKAGEATLRGLREQHRIRAEAQRDASERLVRSREALADLCQAAGYADSGELAEIEQRSAGKQEAMRECEQLETRMLEDGSGLSLDVLLAECEDVVGDSLPGEIAALKDKRAELEVTIDTLMSERARLRAAFEALFAENQAAEALQDAANVEAEIAVLTQDYADLALQEIALRQTIDLYRDRNQGPILDRATALFAQLTDGAYSGLRADVDEKDEAILIAEHPTRGSLEVNALSDGTVDPLYLALRLAAVQEHNANNEPLPFVADDLLLHLDNPRARSTLRTLGTLAETSQVLFFTHHEHMVGLARESLPSAILTEHRL